MPHSAADLHQRLCREAAGGEPTAIAFSGGSDSTALARLAVAAGLKPALLHVDHGTPASGTGRVSAEALAGELGLEFVVLPVTLEAGLRGFEAAARSARYEALSQAWSGAIWLAQTRDDFIETVWMRLLAGSSPQFWDCMPAQRGHFRRPLLGVRRGELRPYMRGAFEDPMNADPSFERVWLRRSGLLAIDPDGALADAAAGLGRRIVALELGSDWGALDRFPEALRAELVRAALSRLLPDARPRRRFVDELARAAASPCIKTRQFRLGDSVLTLQQGVLMLNS